MKSNKNYNIYIGLIRVIACIAILLYHMNLLKGGYLAVCTFLVLSGYLSCISCFKKEKFSFVEYYKNKLLRLYLPLLIVVFITIVVVSFFPTINWFNFKPETTSVLLGYNNFWQLSASLDYFARHINSPFMHLWYMGIILQFDLIFPFVYILLRKVGDKFHKSIPCIITMLLTLLFSIYFYKTSLEKDIMFVYYNTFTRIFSILFGVTLGFIHNYYDLLIPKSLRGKIVSKIVLVIYLILMIIAFIFIGASSKWFAIAMIIITLISCRLIEYANLMKNDYLSIVNKLIKFISDISYELYLIQYPVIFYFQYIELHNILKIILIVCITFVLSWMLYISLQLKNSSNKSMILNKLIFIILMIISSYGFYRYCDAKDYTDEMNNLKNKLSENEKIMKQKQQEYAELAKKEKENWLEILQNLEEAEKELPNVVANLSITGIGDSVMLGAIDNLYQQFPNAYFDAKTSRTAWVANGILKRLNKSNVLGDNILINLGANGDCPESCKIEIMNTIGNRKVFWVNVNNSDRVNSNLIALSAKYNNIYIIDWKNISRDHPEYFVADRIHLTDSGKVAFTKAIYDSIYQVYLKEYNDKKDAIMDDYEKEQKEKISFFGNDVLLNAFDYLKKDFENAEFIIDSNFNYDLLIKEIENRIEEDSLSYKIIFTFDSNIKFKVEDYRKLVELCRDYEIYILDINGTLRNTKFNKAKVIDFYKEIELNDDYLMVDKIHLTKSGNKAITQTIKKYINYEK